MAQPLTYNVGDLLTRAFGVSGFSNGIEIPIDRLRQLTGEKKYPGAQVTEQTPVMIDATSYKNIKYASAPARRQSHLKTPILMPVTLGKGETINWKTIEDGVSHDDSCASFEFPATTMIDFTQAKIIERTQVPGRKGSVKEYIGLDDWRIRIRGILINFENQEILPEAEIKALKNLKNVPVSIPIICDMAQWLDVMDVVIENIDFPAIEGYSNMQPFTIDCLSDDAFEVKYKNGL
jgi:Domain of unknown function (DUF6046)